MCGPGCRGSREDSIVCLLASVLLTHKVLHTLIAVGLMLLPHKMPHTSCAMRPLFQFVCMHACAQAMLAA